jgi:2'-5' RNA ligase
MAVDPNASHGSTGAVEQLSLYALVIYLPDPLRSFLDELRLEMAPACNPHAHVSVLPPRTLPVPPALAIDEARQVLAEVPAFEIALGHIEVFPVTDVIYISVEAGADQLRRMHQSLNRGTLAYDEPFPYHPHITLAQEIESGRLDSLRELAFHRWQEYHGRRTFRAERTVFVRSSCRNQWVDLAEGPLRLAPAG